MSIFDILMIKKHCTIEELKKAKEEFDKRCERIRVPETFRATVNSHYELILRIGIEEYNKRFSKAKYEHAKGNVNFDITNDANFKEEALFDTELEMINKQARINAANRRLDEYEREMERQRRPEKTNKKRKFILTTSVIMAGVLSLTGFGIKAAVNKQTKEDNLNNVCVEYTVQEGDTKNFLDAMFKEYNESYLEVSGPFRNNEIVYAGDVVIGRTTMEKAQELVESGNARIISIEEAVELLGENHSLIGEFRRYAEGKSDIVFYVPQNVNRL